MKASASFSSDPFGFGSAAPAGMDPFASAPMAGGGGGGGGSGGFDPFAGQASSSSDPFGMEFGGSTLTSATPALASQSLQGLDAFGAVPALSNTQNVAMDFGGNSSDPFMSISSSSSNQVAAPTTAFSDPFLEAFGDAPATQTTASAAPTLSSIASSSFDPNPAPAVTAQSSRPPAKSLPVAPAQVGDHINAASDPFAPQPLKQNKAAAFAVQDLFADPAPAAAAPTSTAPAAAIPNVSMDAKTATESSVPKQRAPVPPAQKPVQIDLFSALESETTPKKPVSTQRAQGHGKTTQSKPMSSDMLLSGGGGPLAGQGGVVLEVVKGNMRGSAMWRRLEKLKSIPPSAGLNILKHGNDAPGLEAQARENPTQNIKTGSGKEPDAGAERVTKAIRAADERIFEPLFACRSLQDKRVALDAAIRLTNREIILHIVLWVRETLKHDLFMEELSLRPKAVLVYANYLRDAKRWEQLETFWLAIRNIEVTRYRDRPQLHRNEASTELALCMVRRALWASTPDSQIAALKEVVDFASTIPKGSILSGGSHETEVEMISQYCVEWQELIRRQVEIEKIDLQLESKQTSHAQETNLSNLTEVVQIPIWIKFPRKPVIGIPVLELLQYLALYHPNDREENVTSPKGLKKGINVSEKMFWFAAFTSLARAGIWDVVRKATESKSMFSGKTSEKSPIGWRPLFNLAYEYGDPSKDADIRKLAIYFAAHMEDRDEAYTLCVQKGLWEGAIQACVDMRDEDKLIELRVAITESGGEVRSFIQMIDEVYADKRIKWKTDLTGVTPTLMGSKRLASVGGIFKSAFSKVTSSVTEVHSKTKEASAPSTPVVQEQPKRNMVFGGGAGGLVEDD